MVLLIDEAIRKKLTWAKSRDEFVRRWVELGVTFVLHGRDGQTLIRTLEDLARKER
jgi:2-keto-3-deoxy-L-rhamnonate aldolase RhmA